MSKVALFYPIIPSHKVPEIFSDLTSLYSHAVKKLYEEKTAQLSLSICQPPMCKYIISEGLLSIAAVLIERGHRVDYFEEQHLLDQGNYEDQLSKIARDFTIIGITVLTPMFPYIVELISQFKRISPDTYIVLGGPHVTYKPLDGLRAGADFIIRGEGDFSFADLVDCLERRHNWDKIPGLSFLKNGTYHENAITQPDLNKLPLPAYEIVPSAIRHESSVSFLTSRGCIGKCLFCAEGNFFHGLRYFSEEHIKNKIAKYINIFPYNYILFCDSTFTYPKKRMERIIDLMRDNFPQLFFGCNARADTIDDFVIKKLEKGNFITILFGGESGSDTILGIENKKLKVNDLHFALKKIGSRIPFSLATFIIGHPGETLLTAHKTIEYIQKLFKETNIFQINTRLMTPYPGTPLHDYPERYGIEIINSNYSLYTRYSYPSLTRTKDLSEFETWFLFYEAQMICTMELVRRANMMEEASIKLNLLSMKEFLYRNTKPGISVGEKYD